MKKELLQLHNRTVFDPVHVDSLTNAQKAEALKLLMVLKHKRDDSVKGRGCADGRRQREIYDKEEATSPTVALESILLTAEIDAHKRRDVAVVDIPGSFLQTDLDDDVSVFPILAIDWRITEQLSLSTGRGLAASQGPGLTLSYKFNDQWSFGFSGRYEDIEFRLDDQDIAPGGIGQDKSIPMVLSATFNPSQKATMSFFAGMEFSGELSLEDKAGTTVEQSDYDSATIVGGTFEFRF